MSTRKPRWEIVRTDSGYHCRFRSSNGQIIVASEVYTTRRRAIRAIELLVAPTYGWVEDGAVVCLSSRDAWSKTNRPVAEVRAVDERGQS